jgi:uncharacterized membrane protein
MERIQISIALLDDTPPSQYTVTLESTSLNAEEEGLEVFDNITLTIVVQPRSGKTNGDDEGDTTLLMIAVIAIVLIAIIVIVMIMMMKRKSRSKMDEKSEGKTTATISVDILKPDDMKTKRTLKATPIQAMDGGTGKQLASGSGAPSPTPPTGPGGMLCESAPLTSDRLLPRPSTTHVDVDTPPTPTGVDQPPGGEPQKAPHKVGVDTGVDLDYKKPDIAQFLAERPSTDKAEVYHQSTGAVWTPDMAISRSAKEAESSVQLLKELNELKRTGGISDEEYERSKRRLLRKI